MSWQILKINTYERKSRSTQTGKMWCKKKTLFHPFKFQTRPSKQPPKRPTAEPKPSVRHRNEKRNQFYVPSMPCHVGLIWLVFMGFTAGFVFCSSANDDDVCVCLVTLPAPSPSMRAGWCQKVICAFQFRISCWVSCIFLPPPIACPPPANCLGWCWVLSPRFFAIFVIIIVGGGNVSQMCTKWIGLRCVAFWGYPLVCSPELPWSPYRDTIWLGLKIRTIVAVF